MRPSTLRTSVFIIIPITTSNRVPMPLRTQMRPFPLRTSMVLILFIRLGVPPRLLLPARVPGLRVPPRLLLPVTMPLRTQMRPFPLRTSIVLILFLRMRVPRLGVLPRLLLLTRVPRLGVLPMRLLPAQPTPNENPAPLRGPIVFLTTIILIKLLEHILETVLTFMWKRQLQPLKLPLHGPVL